MINNKFYMIDLDGTMYHGTNILPGAKEFINYLIKNKVQFIFLTNNSSRTQEQAAKHMLNMGFENIESSMFYTSAMAAADTISRLYPSKKKAAYIGEKGMRQALIDYDFVIEPDSPDFLFVGLDRQATYRDYSFALRALKKGAMLIGTNNDRILLSQDGINVGNGSVVAMFEYAANVEAFKIGKPHPAIIEGALRYCNVLKEDVIIIGDNLETDIKLGENAGIETILVTTGVNTMEDCYRLNIKPTYIIDKLSNLIR